MKERETKQKWFPFWADKWIFGSMRIEFGPEERAIWVDLLCLASKDEGHIRANEETPYPIRQLAGMLVVEEEEMEKAIEKFVEKKKLIRTKSGTLLVAKWDKYQISDRHKRRVEKEMTGDEDITSGEADTMSAKSDSNNNIKNIKNNNNKKKKNIKKKKSGNNSLSQKNSHQNGFEKEFEQFWDAYPKKVAKDYAKEKFMILMRKGELENVRKAFNGYVDYLKMRRVKDNFEQEPLNPATFLTKNRWKDYIDYEYKPPL